MKVLVVCDDLWHPAEVIKRGMQGLDSNRYDLDFVMAAKDILTPEYIKAFDVIIVAKGNAVTSANTAPWFEDTVTEVGAKEFREYVEAGGGFISLHAGNTFSWKRDREYCEFIGNSFVTHPLRCPVTIVPTREHPIMAGVKEFTERDEHYELTNFAEDIEVIAESRSQTGGVQAAAYVRHMGEGRLCVLTPGHTLAMWQNEDFLRMLSNAIDWCAKKATE